MVKKTESPLMDIAIFYVTEVNQSLNDDELNTVKENLQKYIDLEITYDELEKIVVPLVKSSDPFQRIRDIISVGSEPLSDFSLAEEKASRRRRTHSWSASEDNRLIFAIHHDGFGDWSNVAAFVGNGRTRSQCS